MLVAANNANVKSFTYAASSSTYGDHKKLPKKEHIIGNPLSPYAVTKYVNELYADVFHKAYAFTSIGLRYFNVFGKRQTPNSTYAAVIPKWIHAILADEEIFINGDWKTSRDFCYISNVIQANLISATIKCEGLGGKNSDDAINQIYNIAVGDRTTLTELYFILRDNLSSRFAHLQDAQPIYRDFRKGDVLHSQADISKAMSRLDYQPSFSANEGLIEAMDWYVNNRKWSQFH